MVLYRFHGCDIVTRSHGCFLWFRNGVIEWPRTDGQVFLYNKLVDLFPKHQLFYLIGGFYFVVFSAIAIALADPVIGVANDNANPTRLIGEENYSSVQ